LLHQLLGGHAHGCTFGDGELGPDFIPRTQENNNDEKPK